ncbi:MAG: response regulator [Spirochaetales bacterium]|nr:response regulator [Spirochaetales bacterium]
MKKILIVDDDADLRQVMQTILTEHYEVKEAESKEEGFKVLESYKPDLMILDVMMETKSSGFEMCREIKNNPELKNIKILMLTSVDSELNIDFQSEVGDKDWLPVDDYIVKPVQPKPFLEKVEKLLN